MLYPLAALLCAIALALAVAASIALSRALRIGLRGVPVAGRIVDHTVDSESSNVLAVVEFVVDGTPHRVESKVFVRPTAAPIGAPRPVLYVPGDPSAARIGTKLELYTPPVALGAAFVLVAALGGGLLWALLFD